MEIVGTSIGFCHIKKAEIASTDQTLGWQISQFNIPDLWTDTQGEGVKVAVLDTGVDIHHEDLNMAGAYDFVAGAGGVPIDYTPAHGHGTHVSGIISAKNDNQGIVGVAPEVEIYSCRVLDDDGYGGWFDMMDALDWCIENNIDVINMSLGGGNPGEIFYRKIREVYDAGIVIVAAAGNDSWDYGYLNFPGIYDETISVASTNASMNRSSFSSIGSNIDIAAPGEAIFSTTPANTYTIMSGTSMATPFITGLIALIISKHRKLGGNTPADSVEEIRNHLTYVATDMDFDGQDMYLGNGIVNPKLSLDIVGKVENRNILNMWSVLKSLNMV